LYYIRRYIVILLLKPTLLTCLPIFCLDWYLGERLFYLLSFLFHLWHHYYDHLIHFGSNCVLYQRFLCLHNTASYIFIFSIVNLIAIWIVYYYIIIRFLYRPYIIICFQCGPYYIIIFIWWYIIQQNLLSAVPLFPFCIGDDDKLLIFIFIIFIPLSYSEWFLSFHEWVVIFPYFEDTLPFNWLVLTM
jgi:hypothetical protein